MSPHVLASVLVAVAQTLVLDQASHIERVLQPGETQLFEIRLNAGEFVRVSVEPQLPQVFVALQAPAGEQIARRMRSDLNSHAETISAIAEKSGNYRLIVESKWKTPGWFVVRVLEHRLATARDRDRIEAERLYFEGRSIKREQNPEVVQKSIASFTRARELFRKLGDDGAAADAENEIGEIYSYILGEYQKGLPHLLNALAVRQCLPEASARGNSLDNIGDVYRTLGELRKAIVFFEAALAEKNPEVPRQVAVTLRNLAMTHDDMGDEEALPQFLQLLEMMRAAGEPIGVAFLHHSIATHHYNRGEYQQALEHAQQTLRIWRNMKHRAGEGYATLLIGQIYETQGEPERALTYYQKALTLPEVPDHRVKAEATWRISRAHHALGDFDRAIALQQEALRTYRGMGDRILEAEVLRGLGGAYAKKGEPAKALEYFAEALPISQGLNHPTVEGFVLVEMAAAQFELGKYDAGRESAARAIDIFRSNRYPSAEASAHLARARIEQASGNLDVARAEAETSVRITEKLRGNIGTPETRATFVASVWDAYEVYVDVLMRLHEAKPGEGFDARALEASEQARGRSLIDLLAESRVGAPQRTRVERVRSLRERISAKAQAQLKLAARNNADGEEINRQMEELNAQYELLMAEMRRDDPALAAVASPEPLAVAQIQRELLDDSTVLLEYSLGASRSFLWVVTSEKLFSFQLPPRDEIESAVRAAYQTLSARSGGTEHLDSVSRMVLAPAAAALRARRLVIVPDGALQYLPFATLLSPRTRQPLVNDHEIVTLPSASALAVLRRHPRNQRTTKLLAVFADPVFDSDDPRLTARFEQVASMETSRGVDDEMVETEVERSAREAGLIGLPRLPFTRREAIAVLSLVPQSQRKEALDFAATRSAVFSADLRKYRFVHFATHGLLNNFHPELSGIVLSMVDEKGKELDGFLSTADVFNLSLSADLVVLSGCRTGLGKEIRGEGIAGLTRAFMYAGAPRVVASLWNVNDAATAELMKRFYQGMLGPNRLSPPAALRAAQLSLQKEKRWSDPYYWAAFVIQGEWN